jgi:hypothetical protein
MPPEKDKGRRCREIDRLPQADEGPGPDEAEPISRQQSQRTEEAHEWTGGATMIRRHELPSWIAYAIAAIILFPAAFVVHPLVFAAVWAGFWLWVAGECFYRVDQPKCRSPEHLKGHQG